mmetsp:Transcript_35172/g.100207  ORF Transcript_35172/g.100207 Transcript_35172/m.100207 type:complete len:251 (+) Transcript_35172:778-1530(+)
MASPSSCAVSFGSTEVPRPHLCAVTRSAMSCWSAKTGVTIVGEPAPNEAWTVPMPPWCTQQAHCGKSHSCGAAFMKSTFSSQNLTSPSASGPLPSDVADKSAQPPTMTPRCPATFKASTARRAMCSAEFTDIEPQPMYTGGDALAINSEHRWSSSPTLKKEAPSLALESCSSRLKHSRPKILTPLFGQSSGADQKASLKTMRLGTGCSSFLNMSKYRFSALSICSVISGPAPSCFAFKMASSFPLAMPWS